MPGDAPTRDELRAANCWFSVDRVARDDATTAWKRRARYRQALWRGVRPAGFEPYAGADDEKCQKKLRKPVPVGSRLELEFAKSSTENLLTRAALQAALARIAAPEPYQMLSTDRLWADLLSSMPLCFNLFGDLAADPPLARRAVRTWFPDAPEGDVRVGFEYSPGRRDPLFLGNRTAFDAAFEIAGANSGAIIGIETKYHEHAAREAPPKKTALARYVQVTEESGAFASGWREELIGTDLQQIWLDHLLVLSMLQHPSKRWSWGKSVLVYPQENPSFAAAARRYAAVLADATTFQARTLEELLAAPGALPAETVSVFRGRYLSPAPT